MEERRKDYGELLKKIEDQTIAIHGIKGKQITIEQYLQVQFGGKDLIGIAMEGNVTRALRELNDKVKIQNGRVSKVEDRTTILENWRWQLLGIALGSGAVMGLMLKFLK